MSSQHLGYHKKSLICSKFSIHVVQTRTYMHQKYMADEIWFRIEYISFTVVIEEQQM